MMSAQKREPSLRTRQPSSSTRPLLDCEPQQLGRTPALEVFLRKEAGEVLADDLVGCVVLDALGARIPCHDVAVAIEKVDGVIAHARRANERKLQVACARANSLASCCSVTSRTKLSTTVPAGSLQRLEHDVDRKLGAILAQPEKIQGRAHLAGPRMSMVVFAMAGMARPEALGDKDLDRLGRSSSDWV